MITNIQKIFLETSYYYLTMFDSFADSWNKIGHIRFFPLNIHVLIMPVSLASTALDLFKTNYVNHLRIVIYVQMVKPILVVIRLKHFSFFNT